MADERDRRLARPCARTDVDADVRRARPRRARPAARSTSSSPSRTVRPRDEVEELLRDIAEPDDRSRASASPGSSRPSGTPRSRRGCSPRLASEAPALSIQRMSSGQGRVDVEIESKRPTRARRQDEGASEHVSRLRLALPGRRARAHPPRVPAVRPPLPGPCARADRAARRSRDVRRGGRGAPLGGPARVLRSPAVHRAARRGGGGDRARRRDRDRERARSRSSRAGSRSWTSRSWAARWGASSARSSCVRARARRRRACRSSRSRRRAAPGCRRASSLSCSCRRRSARSRSCTRAAARSSRS